MRKPKEKLVQPRPVPPFDWTEFDATIERLKKIYQGEKMTYPSLKEQKQSNCKHFTGTMNKTCDAGINYEAVTAPNPSGVVRSLPCLTQYNEAGCACEKREFYTDAEIDAQIEEVEGSMNRVRLARKAIVDFLGGPWKKGMTSRTGQIACPNCKGVLHFSRAGYNGHIHAQCDNPDCVAWME